MEGENIGSVSRDNFFSSFGCEGERKRGIARGRHVAKGRIFHDVTGLNKSKS